MEKALADSMAAAGYNVINKVHCRATLDVETFHGVRDAFAASFRALQSPAASTECAP